MYISKGEEAQRQAELFNFLGTLAGQLREMQRELEVITAKVKSCAPKDKDQP